MGIYEDRVKRLREHVLAQEKKAEKPEDKGLEALTNKELMAMLDEMGVEYEKKANKATLLALLEKANNPEEDPEDDGEPEGDPEDDNEDPEEDDDDEGAE